MQIHNTYSNTNAGTVGCKYKRDSNTQATPLFRYERFIINF